MDHSHHASRHHHNQAAAPGKHAGHSVAMFKQKFWVTLLLSLPVLAYSGMIQRWLRFTPPDFAGAEYIPLVFSTAIFGYGGLVFLRGAWAELRARRPGMMTLISLAITTAYLYSVAAQFFMDGAMGGEGFFWELATLVTIMLLGHWLEMAAVARAESALDAIAQLLPDHAEKLVDGQPRQVPVSQLRVGDLVLVRPGAAIPADGEVTEGRSSVDESAVSGESKPVTKNAGDAVVAGTTNQDGALTVRVAKLGDDTALAGIMRLVAEAQRSKSNAQLLADKAAFVLTIVAIATAILTFVAWLAARNAGFALERAVTVLVIACPHALGLAIPLVVSISTALSARNGLLVRQRLALESARGIGTVLFDKTGTLTQGRHGVTGVWAADGYTPDDVLRLAASLEQPSEHIIGKGIVRHAAERGVRLEPMRDFTVLPGQGVRGVLDGKTYAAVSRAYVEEHRLALPAALRQPAGQAAQDGKTEVYVTDGARVIGLLALADMVRPESAQAVAELKALGIRTAMITGDSQAVAAAVAAQLGLDQYFAGVKPQDKAAKVKALQRGGQKVAMVGDGINDAPALAQADIGLAIGAGTDAAIRSAGILLVKNDPRDAVKVINLSRAAYRKMLQNLAWAAGYNIVAIPLAAGVLYGAGIVLAPAIGAVLMSVSTVVVAVNAQLLRRARLEKGVA